MKQLETFLKLIIIGILTALVRAYGQGFIPIIEEPLFWPSIFVDGGIQFLGFIVFGSVFYTAIAALFLLMNKNMKGRRFFKGLKFSLFLIIIWTAYLLEPLPHVTVTDMIAYPLVDGAALLILGILSGLLIGTKGKNTLEVEADQRDEMDEENSKINELGSIVDNILSLEEEELEGQSVELKEAVTLTQDNEEEIQDMMKENYLKVSEGVKKKRSKRKFSPLNVIIIGLIFFLVRIAMYKYFSIYSYFGTHAVETLIWALLTGLAIGVVYEMTTRYICRKTWYLRFLIFGAVFLSVILIGFNGFMPLIYRRDMSDLALRTIGDVAAVILAGGICLLFDFRKNIGKPLK
ncbi:MAG: hypothetical protein RR844_07895 [Clostridium sp.]